MSSHVAHADRNEAGLPLLFDDCERCEEQAGELGIHLDSEKWARAWKMMLAVEYDIGEGRYMSHADRRLGRQLYILSLVLQRNTLIAPEALPLA